MKKGEAESYAAEPGGKSCVYASPRQASVAVTSSLLFFIFWAGSANGREMRHACFFSRFHDGNMPVYDESVYLFISSSIMGGR